MGLIGFEVVELWLLCLRLCSNVLYRGIISFENDWMVNPNWLANPILEALRCKCL